MSSVAGIGPVQTDEEPQPEVAMGKLIYTMNVSLDGYVETLDHSLEWSAVDDELHRWFNEHERRADAFLYGRRLYETMAAFWPHGETDPASTPTMVEYARIWNAKPKIVFSRTLDSVAWNSRLVRDGDPADELARLRAEFPGELHVGGATLAASFIERGLVDEYRLVIHPVILGGGTPFFPKLERPTGLRLIETHAFGGGALLVAYAAA
jgi:dihydrofolate reductase